MAGYRECFAQAVAAAVAGVTVLTGNQRSARAIQSAAEEQLSLQRSSWHTPVVLPTEAFAARLYEDALLIGATQAIPLQREQELQLWRQIIERSPAGRKMLLPESAAALAAQSFRLAMEYKIALDSAAMNASSDTRTFAGWAAEFRAQLAERRWIAASMLKAELGPALVRLCLPAQLLVYLAEPSPAQREFLAALEHAGVQVQVATGWAERGEIHALRYEYDGIGEELRAAAEWARRQIEDSPEARVGVVFFDLERKRTQVESTFRAVLTPEQLFGEHSPRAFEVAAPLSLNEYPVVRCALLLLEFVAGTLDFYSLEAMLTSPYLGHSASSAAKLLSRVRKRVRRPVGPEELVGWLREPCELPHLLAAIERLPARSALGAQLGASHWAELARQTLSSFGWPGVALSSEEFQCTESWRELVAAIASLELLAWRGDFAAFVSQLSRAASARRFKPESIEAPVQIMDAAEAEGSVLDALWIGSCTDQLWPESLHAPALVPLALLEAAGFPLAGSAAAQARTVRQTSRLLQSAPAISLSLARCGEDEGEQLWSPLFAEIALGEMNLWSPPLSGLLPQAELESLSDAAAPALREDEDVHGGTSLLEEQSGCPFRAFATRRLAARREEGPFEELEAFDRGKLVERALQLIWQELLNSEGLRRPGRESIVARAIDTAMEELLDQREDAWSQRFRQIERDRLLELLNQWLQVESLRPPFRVSGHQLEAETKLAGLRLNLRIDRIDETGGACLVLDYKTGSNNSVGAWCVPRPLKPQLPLYVVAQQMLGRAVAGAAFAEIRPGECGFRGYLRSSSLLNCPDPTKRTFGGVTFDEYTKQWASELERIAESFVEGGAAVDPKIAPGKSQSPCNYCHLAQLCRIGDAVENEADEEAGDE